MEFWRMPLDAAEQEVVIGRVNILPNRCKGCRYCIEFCPAGVLDESREFNDRGYHPPFVKDPTKCKECTFCETVCPEFAIYITEAERRPLEADNVLRVSKAPRPRRRGRREG